MVMGVSSDLDPLIEYVLLSVERVFSVRKFGCFSSSISSSRQLQQAPSLSLILNVGCPGRLQVVNVEDLPESDDNYCILDDDSGTDDYCMEAGEIILHINHIVFHN